MDVSNEIVRINSTGKNVAVVKHQGKDIWSKYATLNIKITGGVEFYPCKLTIGTETKNYSISNLTNSYFTINKGDDIKLIVEIDYMYPWVVDGKLSGFKNDYNYNTQDNNGYKYYFGGIATGGRCDIEINITR